MSILDSVAAEPPDNTPFEPHDLAHEAERLDPADAQFQRELRDAAVRRIRFLIDFYQVQPGELKGSGPAARPVDLAAAERAPKYRHPTSGATWDGVGSQPPWLRDALLREGRTVEELKVDAARHPDADPS